MYIYFSEQKFKCQCCEFVCTDGAVALIGRLSDFVPWLKKKAKSSISSSRFISRRFALTSKTPNPIVCTDLKNTEPDIKWNPLRGSTSSQFHKTNREIITRLFCKRCAEMVSEHRAILFHSEVRWLSRGIVIKGLFELRREVYWWRIWLSCRHSLNTVSGFVGLLVFQIYFQNRMIQT